MAGSKPKEGSSKLGKPAMLNISTFVLYLEGMGMLIGTTWNLNQKTPLQASFSSCGGWTRTSDLQVMGLTSCHCSTPRG
jgi:hypothetical protein